MYAWTLLTEANCQPGTKKKNAFVFYYIHMKILYSVWRVLYLHMVAKFCWIILWLNCLTCRKLFTESHQPAALCSILLSSYIAK